MHPWRQLTRGVRALLRRGPTDQAVADEVEHYLAEAAAAHRARGLPDDEALRAARVELGGVTQSRESIRNVGWENRVERVGADIGYAFRRLGTEPAFTAVAILTLALGLGASTAILSVVNPILFSSLPYPSPDRIVTLWDRGPDGARAEVTFGNFIELRARSRSFAAVALTKPWQPTLTGRGEPERLEGQRVSAGYFRVFGVTPALGRDFSTDDDRTGVESGVLLSDRLWRRRFSADPSVLGRSIVMGDERYVVLGVLPPRFENVLAPAVDLWAPLQYELSQPRAWGHHLRMVGRLRPGVTASVAAAELTQIAQRPVVEYGRQPWASMATGFTVTPLQEDVTRGVRPALLALLGAVALLLVMACVNVTNLLLARGVRRRGELAVRLALGAGRARLVRQLLLEHLVLALVGGTLGLLLARLGIDVLVAFSPPELPRLAAVGLDRTVFGAGLALTLVTGLVFGSVAALSASHESPQGTLHLASRRSSGAHRRVRGALVIAQVAMALILLVTSGLLFRSLNQLFAVRPGFNASRLLTLQVQTSGQRFSADSTTYRFFANALAAVRQVPGVQSAALTSQLPLSGEADMYGVRFATAVSDSTSDHSSFRYTVSPGYFETMGIQLRRGRLLGEGDREGSTPVAVISESMARHRLPGLDPIGEPLTVGDNWHFTVAGVVADVKQQSLALADANAIYIAGAQWPFADRVISFVIRARTDPATLIPAIRQAIWSVDRAQAIVRVAPMETLLADSTAERRFALMIFEVFALAALALAASGIYGVLSGSVAERTREIGVRTALGASRGGILGLVVGQGMTLVGIGALVGAVGAAFTSQLVSSMLFGVSPLDPVTFLSVLAIVAFAALLACSLPAWRASRVDPVHALRAE